MIEGRRVKISPSSTTLLLFLALSLAGSSAVFYWKTLLLDPAEGLNISNQVEGIKAEFKKKYPSSSTLNLTQLRQSRDSEELIHPKTLLPTSQYFDYQEISALYRYARTCENSLTGKIRNPGLTKALVWHRWICGKLADLPGGVEGFFAAQPMMHPSGASYAYFALNSGRFADSEFLRENSRRFHILEEPNREKVVAQFALNAEELQKLLAEESLILTSTHIFFREGRSQESAVSYRVFLRETWEAFLKNQPWVASHSASQSCAHVDGEICWNKNLERQGSQTRLFAILLFSAFLLLGSGGLIAWIRRSRAQKLEMERRLFILQMLTHELRTPVTAMSLSNEVLRREFDQLPVDSQKAFLALTGGIQRLSRVIEGTKTYLSSQNTGELMKISPYLISSTNDFFKGLLEPYSDRVTFAPLQQDRAASLDPYWTEICVINLLENALQHGKPPYCLRILGEGDHLKISVMDAGLMNETSLEELAKPFRRGSSSRGLGLGLSIVKKVVDSMNGDLVLQTQPTAFSILLKGVD